MEIKRKAATGKEAEKAKKMRKWRLIVRNAAFTCSEEDVRNCFGKFGDIHEIVMPQKKNQFAGYCFVQFDRLPDATKAIKETNGVKIKGRTIAVDWAVPKDEYMTSVIEEKTKQVQSEEEPTPLNIEDGGVGPSFKSEEEEENEEEVQKKTKVKRVPRVDPALEEGRTLFIRSIPFDVDDEELQATFAQFGQTRYALICKYPNTDHSKGSGFVQFDQKSAADACLQKNEEVGVFLRNQKMLICKAVEKSAAVKIDREKLEKLPKDNRNLHLLRVGLVRAGTTEARGMSTSDSNLRTRIEAANRHKIKNLQIFVSPTRLCVHNLPATLTDRQLRDLCTKCTVDEKSPPKIVECRIMRDLKRLNADGRGKSRGYAFVEFASHEHALTCLKYLNNNSDVFTDEKRPVVEFSLENRTALNAKLKRAENARNAAKQKPVDDVGGRRSVVPKVTFKPQVVRPAAGASKVTKNPFPSHTGPKIRHKQRNTVGDAPGGEESVAKKTTKKRGHESIERGDVKKRRTAVGSGPKVERSKSTGRWFDGADK